MNLGSQTLCGTYSCSHLQMDKLSTLKVIQVLQSFFLPQFPLCIKKTSYSFCQNSYENYLYSHSCRRLINLLNLCERFVFRSIFQERNGNVPSKIDTREQQKYQPTNNERLKFILPHVSHSSQELIYSAPLQVTEEDDSSSLK